MARDRLGPKLAGQVLLMPMLDPSMREGRDSRSTSRCRRRWPTPSATTCRAPPTECTLRLPARIEPARRPAARPLRLRRRRSAVGRCRRLRRQARTRRRRRAARHPAGQRARERRGALRGRRQRPQLRAVKNFLAPFTVPARAHPTKSVASVLHKKTPEVPHDLTAPSPSALTITSLALASAGMLTLGACSKGIDAQAQTARPAAARQRRRRRRKEGHRAERVLRPHRGGGIGPDPRPRARHGRGHPLQARLDGEEGRPALHDRPACVPRRDAARRGLGRRRRGEGRTRPHRTRTLQAPAGRQRHLAAWTSTNARRNARQLDAAARAEAAALASAKLNLEYSAVRAPFSGRIGKAEVTIGNLVDGNIVLTSLVSVDPVYVAFDGDEGTYLAPRPGRPRRRRGGEGAAGPRQRDRLPARRPASTSWTTASTRRRARVRMRAVVDNKNGTLTPGLFARVQIGAEANSTAAVLINDTRHRHRPEPQVRLRAGCRQQGRVPRGRAGPGRSTACAWPARA